MAEKTEKKYVITNHRSGKVLASCGGSAVQMTANGGETQVWCAVPAEGTSVQLVHKVSGLALTVPGEAENGTALVLAEAQGNVSQLWKLTTTVKGCRRITHVASGKVVAAVFTEFRVFGARAAVWAKKLTVRNICTAIFADHKKISFAYLNICPPKS